MADKADAIQQAIKKGRLDAAETRSAITKKLEILEDRVQETIETVKHTFDLHYQVKQRPWIMFGGSLVVGYMLGRRGGVPGTTSYVQPPQSIVSEVSEQIKGDLATIKGAAFGAVMSMLWAMTKRVLLPQARQDTAIIKPEALPIDSPEIINQVAPSKTNGRSEV